MKESRIVLMYHDVISEAFPKSGFQKIGSLQYTLSYETFSKQISCCQSANIVCSFDDGGSSFYTLIPDILERNHKKGIFFISTDFIDTEGFLSTSQIKELDKRGHIIASHSHTHPARISAYPKDRCLWEWKESKRILESIVGHEVSVASVPGGAVSKMVIDCMIDVGFKEIYTSKPTTKIRYYRNAKVMGRYGITRDMNHKIVSKLIESDYYRNKLLVRYQILRYAKLLMGEQYNNVKQFFFKCRDKFSLK